MALRIVRQLDWRVIPGLVRLLYEAIQIVKHFTWLLESLAEYEEDVAEKTEDLISTVVFCES